MQTEFCKLTILYFQILMVVLTFLRGLMTDYQYFWKRRLRKSIIKSLEQDFNNVELI